MLDSMPSAPSVDALTLGSRTRRVVRRVVDLGIPLSGRSGLEHRLLPSVLVIGAQRCGTTSVHRALAAHPGVVPPRRGKGVHYYDTTAYTRGLAWYRTHFPVDDGSNLAMESSPCYLFHPAAPTRVAADLPDVKLIVVLRDPVQRAISHHRHEVARGFEDLALAEALEHEDERLAGAVDLLRHDASAVHDGYLHHSYKARGRYAEQLERWLQLFAREQICILDANLMFTDPQPAMESLTKFLGLDTRTPLTLGHVNGYPDVDVAPDTRAELTEYFEPHDARLEALLGWRPSWR